MQTGVIRVIDIVFIQKDAQGNVVSKEIGELDDAMYDSLTPVVADITGLVSQEDIDKVQDMLEPNSSAAVMLFEHRWATDLRDKNPRRQGRVGAERAHTIRRRRGRPQRGASEVTSAEAQPQGGESCVEEASYVPGGQA